MDELSVKQRIREVLENKAYSFLQVRYYLYLTLSLMYPLNGFFAEKVICLYNP